MCFIKAFRKQLMRRAFFSDFVENTLVALSLLYSEEKMTIRIIVKTKTGKFSESPIFIDKNNDELKSQTCLYDISKVVERRTNIVRSLHLYYEGETLVNQWTFLTRENPPEINLWLYVKGSSSKAVKNVCTKLGIEQDFSVYFKSPTADKQFENVKFDLSLSSTVADLKEAIKAKHKWLKVSWQTLVYEMNGKYHKVLDGDYLMDFPRR